jgi:phosphatidylglycerophosphate synthase
MTASAAHTRVNLGLTAALERRLLIWIAERLPRFITSDRLSALGLAGMAMAGAAFAAYRFTPWAAAAAIAALAVNWFGDSLDGTLARVRRQQRPRYGFYVDHVIDLAGTTMLVAGLGASQLMHPLIAGAVLIGYLLVAAESYLATHVSGVFRMSFLGFGPTELRLVLMAGALRVMQSPTVDLFGSGIVVRLFDVGGVVAAAGLGCAFVIAAIRSTRALYRAEPLPAACATPEAA